MKIRLLVLLMGCHIAAAAFAHEIEQPNAIYQAVEQHVANELSLLPSSMSDVKTQISPLDSRLRLQACEAPLQTLTEFGNIKQKHLTVKVSCEGPVKWSLRIPVKLQIFQTVIVASQQIVRDQILTQQDLHLHKQDVGQIGDGYFQNEKELVGLSSVKNIPAGQVIKRHMVRQPITVHRGETVKIVVSSPGFNLEAAGVAQADGAIGDTIKVKNVRSNRMVDAKVKASGEVTI